MTEFSKQFGYFYDLFLYLPDRLFLRKRRKRLISKLSGKILEVGFGTGMNFEHYNDKATIIGIEPSPHMFVRGKEKVVKLQNGANFELYNIGCGYSEMTSLIEEESLDAVVCTLVLCTIPEPEEAISNFKKWLKPNGKLIVIEHIKSHNKGISQIQNLFNSPWQHISGGCQLNRPTDVILANSGLKKLVENHFWLGMPFYEAILTK